MARETPGQTLQPTALVHEAWLRLVGGETPQFNDRAHFFGAAAEAMRRILIERARRKAAQRHGGGQQRVDIDEIEIAAPARMMSFWRSMTRWKNSPRWMRPRRSWSNCVSLRG